MSIVELKKQLESAYEKTEKQPVVTKVKNVQTAPNEEWKMKLDNLKKNEAQLQQTAIDRLEDLMSQQRETDIKISAMMKENIKLEMQIEATEKELTDMTAQEE